MSPLFSPSELFTLASKFESSPPCEECLSFPCKGWETLSSSIPNSHLKKIGTLRKEPFIESWNEFHPDGTVYWSPNAPIHTTYHPYNRSDVYQCESCRKLYLRYTEHGGYYIEERIREVNPQLLVL